MNMPIVMLTVFQLLFVCMNQYAMLDHFYQNKASILCRPVDEACKRAARLSSNQLADIRSCDSFQRYGFAQMQLHVMTLLLSICLYRVAQKNKLRLARGTK